MRITPDTYSRLATTIILPENGEMITFAGVCVDPEYMIAGIAMPSGAFAVTQFLPEAAEFVEANLRRQLAEVKPAAD